MSPLALLHTCVLQCVAACCSELQCVVVFCRCVAVCVAGVVCSDLGQLEEVVVAAACMSVFVYTHMCIHIYRCIM